jgi:methylmalonyl-CoA/ethylmalonyl-CoA epimerase
MSEPIGIAGLRQVAQHAPDLDASVAFYRDVLGLRLIARFDPPGLAFFDLGGTRLLLEGAASPALLYLEVDDIGAAHNALQQRGVEFVEAPHAIFRDDAGQFGPAGQEEWMAFFKDPAGNTVALASRS